MDAVLTFAQYLKREIMSDCSGDEQPPLKVRLSDSAEVPAARPQARTRARPQARAFADIVQAFLDEREADVVQRVEAVLQDQPGLVEKVTGLRDETASGQIADLTPTEPDSYSTELDELSELEELSAADSVETLRRRKKERMPLPRRCIAADTLERLLLSQGDSEPNDSMSDESFDSELTANADPMGSPRSVGAPAIEDPLLHVPTPHWSTDDNFWRSVDDMLCYVRGTAWCDLSSEMVGGPTPPHTGNLLCRPTWLRPSAHPPLWALRVAILRCSVWQQQ
jgi:hypothetical protein